MHRKSIFAAVGVIWLLFASAPFANPDRVKPLTDPALLALITNDDSFAVADLTAIIDPTQTSTQHYGPYSSGSPDSGTCGNDWAEDTFDRDFTVKRNTDGTFTVIEQFKNGTFVTNGGPSPGACDTTDGTPPGLLSGGEAGSLHGYFIVSNVATQTSTSPYCDATVGTNVGCTTTTFINTHFTPCYPATCTVTTFFDHYSAGDQMLVGHEWKNASADRGGNHGDIAAIYVP